LIPRQKNMKPACRGGICSADEDGSGFASWHALSAVALAKVEVPLHTAQPCFMHRRCASYIRLFRLGTAQPQRAKTAETAPVFISLRRGKPFHSAMKHFPLSLQI